MTDPQENELHEFDIPKYHSSLKRLDEIFRNISSKVNETSLSRCPYKNADDRCTAKFGCRNQDRDVAESELFICLGSDKLNYQSAWNLQESI